MRQQNQKPDFSAQSVSPRRTEETRFFVSRLFRSRRLRLLLLVPGLALGWIMALAIEIATYATVQDDDPAAAAIVLGAAAWNGQPSPVFEERIKHAINLYRAGRVQSIIFTGGVGEGEATAEAIAASRYAVARGVASQDVYCETVSHFTHENLLGAKAIVEQQQFDRVLVVSDPLHMRRAVTMARDFGLNAYPAPTPTSRYISLSSQLGFLWSEVRYYTSYLVKRPWLNKEANYAAVQPCE
ncbi:hypothetical protein TFLX_01962 [Thermoflexales bacterium]|nr:hypothetical protein TFLX_01962 [Thermoflexales bacterium]